MFIYTYDLSSKTGTLCMIAGGGEEIFITCMVSYVCWGSIHIYIYIYKKRLSISFANIIYTKLIFSVLLLCKKMPITSTRDLPHIRQVFVMRASRQRNWVQKYVYIMMTSSNGNIFRVTGHWSPLNSPHKGQWRGAFMFSLICAWINHWVNNGEAGDLKRCRAHYDVMVMM